MATIEERLSALEALVPSEIDRLETRIENLKGLMRANDARIDADVDALQAEDLRQSDERVGDVVKQNFIDQNQNIRLDRAGVPR